MKVRIIEAIFDEFNMYRFCRPQLRNKLFARIIIIIIIITVSGTAVTGL
jgi:hypothetical protein